jgi:hypothetical protein
MSKHAAPDFRFDSIDAANGAHVKRPALLRFFDLPDVEIREPCEIGVSAKESPSSSCS